MKPDLSVSDYMGLELQSQRNRFAETMFSELDEHPCSPKENVLLNLGTLLLALSPVLIVLAFRFFN